MRITFTAILALLYSFTFSQVVSIDSKLYVGPEWFEGSILLNNGTELKGLVKYNDKNDIVCLETAHDSKSLTARSVKAFEFYDESMQKQRVFYAVAIEDRQNNVKRPVFFELVMDLVEFALLSKLSPIKIEKREYSTPAMFNPGTGSFSSGRYYGYPSTVSHTETLFVYTKEGLIRPYLQIVEKDIDGMFFDRSVIKNRVIDDNAIKIHTSPYFGQLEWYARKNALRFEEKNDLIAILKYYDELKQN